MKINVQNRNGTISDTWRRGLGFRKMLGKKEEIEQEIKNN